MIGRQLRVPTLSAAVADWVAEEIVSGRWAHGRRLREVEIAEKLGVSRQPVREALRALSEQGLVIISPRLGAEVARFNTATVAQIYETRSYLESWICTTAVPKLAADDLTELAALLGRMERARDNEDHSEFYDTGWLYRERLYRRCGNEVAIDTVRTLRGRLRSLPLVLQRDPEYPAFTWQVYRDLQAACAAGDATAAGALVQRYLDACRELVVAYFQNLASRQG